MLGIPEKESGRPKKSYSIKASSSCLISTSPASANKVTSPPSMRMTVSSMPSTSRSLLRQVVSSQTLHTSQTGLKLVSKVPDFNIKVVRRFIKYQVSTPALEDEAALTPQLWQGSESRVEAINFPNSLDKGLLEFLKGNCGKARGLGVMGVGGSKVAVQVSL